MKNSSRIVTVNQELNRNKVLDEAIFLAICGRNLCKENSCITGITRLVMSYNKLGKVIKKINEVQKWAI